MQIEFRRLENLGWRWPPLNSFGLFKPSFIDESKISFPSESYDSAEINIEATGFWASERANLIAEMLSATGATTLWEIGAGNGNAAIPLRNLGINVITIEPLESGAITLARNGFPTFCATLEDLKLPSNSISAIGAFDVLEHLEKPEELLMEIHRVLKPGGTFICSVPAYQWLFSDFDSSIGHYRRYSQKELKRLLGSVKFISQDIRALFGFLVLPALVLRKIPYMLGSRKNLKQVHSSLGGNSKVTNKLEVVLRTLSRLERKFHLPVGLSIIAIAKKY